MDCFRTTSLFTDCQVTRTKRHVPQPTMTSPTWCCLRHQKRLLSSTYPLFYPNRKVLIWVNSLQRMNLRRSRTKSIFNGLPLRTITKLFSVPWACTNMVRNPSPVLPTSGLLLQFRIRGTRNLFLKTSLQPTKSLQLCQNIGIYMRHPPWCLDLHNPQQ